MKAIIVGLALTLASALPARAAQTLRSEATLRVTVVDPTGAVIVGAAVSVQAVRGTADVAKESGARGEAIFTGLEPGRYTIRVASPGFEPREIREAAVRPGENRREVKLEIAKLAETVDVRRDPREAATDRRGDAFATVLGPADLAALPDDPDELEQALKDLAGPGAALRVNGFRGGRMPPKDQIQQVRLRRNLFAADMHEPGFIAVDVITKPGLENWRGSTAAAFRDRSLNARNAFAPAKGDERNERYAFSFGGPLWHGRTSLALSADGVDAFDTKTIVAAVPSGLFSESIRKPNESVGATARIEHLLTPKQVLRVEFQRQHSMNDNMGAGDFDLPERAYRQSRDERIVRGSLSGSIRKTLFNEMRIQWRTQETVFEPASVAPAVLVLNAFNSGGAQISGSVATAGVEVADDLDIAIRTHAIRTGFQLDDGRYRSDQRRNGSGTFTFASLEAFAAGRPTTFTRNVGNPNLTVSQYELAAYVQDDIRVRKDLTVSVGVREESQSHVDGLHWGPRGGIAWSPFRSGKTTVRAGGGIFFDWFDAQSYQQALQLDGTHQQIETIVGPGFPDPLAAGRALALPPGRARLAGDLAQPELREIIGGIEQQLPGGLRLSAIYTRRLGVSRLRASDVNAPIAGVRPDAMAGTVTEIQTTARSWFDGLNVMLNFARPERRIMVAAGYVFSRMLDEADSAFALPANNLDPAAERGPALTDARHRFMSVASVPLTRTLRLGTSVRAQSALPYNITTGRDDNGDTVSNDRPAGVGRNSGRGRAQIDVSMRLGWTLGFGTRAGSGTPQGPQVRIIRGNDENPLAGTPMGGDASRYSAEIYAQVFNALNRTNALNFGGVMTSPFFGQPTSAAPPRRIELGVRLMF